MKICRNNFPSERLAICVNDTKYARKIKQRLLDATTSKIYKADVYIISILVL